MKNMNMALFFKRAKVKIILIMFILCTLSGCSQLTNNTPDSKSMESKNTKKKDEIVVTFGAYSEPAAGFDPTTGWGSIGSPLFQSTLVTLDKDMHIVYDLATKYTISGDGREYIFELRRDVKFTDGEPLEAEDVAYTFETAVRSGSVVDLNYLDKVEIVDTNVVKFILKTPQSPFIYAVAKIGIVPKHAHNECYGENPVGSGPFKLVQWDRGQQMIAEANPDYYGKKPYFKKITFLYYAEDAAFSAAKAGELDIVFTNPSLAAQSIEGMELLVIKSIDNRGICMPYIPYGSETRDGKPVGNDVTSDVAIRKAMSIGIDRQVLVDGVLNGYGSPAYSMCDGMPWYSEDNYLEDGKIVEAKQILEDDGWVDTDGDGIREKNGVKAEFTIFYTSGDQVRQGLNIAVAEQLKSLGINANIEGKSWDEILKNYLHTNPMLFGKGIQDPLELYNVHSTDLRGVLNNNPGYYSNARVDEYMQKAFEATTEQEANKYWKLAQWDGKTGCSYKGDAAWVWLVNVDHLYFIKEGLDVGEQRLHPHKYGTYALTDTIIDWCWK